MQLFLLRISNPRRNKLSVFSLYFFWQITVTVDHFSAIRSATAATHPAIAVLSHGIIKSQMLAFPDITHGDNQVRSQKTAIGVARMIHPVARAVRFLPPIPRHLNRTIQDFSWRGIRNIGELFSPKQITLKRSNDFTLLNRPICKNAFARSLCSTNHHVLMVATRHRRNANVLVFFDSI